MTKQTMYTKRLKLIDQSIHVNYFCFLPPTGSHFVGKGFFFLLLVLLFLFLNCLFLMEMDTTVVPGRIPSVRDSSFDFRPRRVDDEDEGCSCFMDPTVVKERVWKLRPLSNLRGSL
jgi:hypothetical protein